MFISEAPLGGSCEPAASDSCADPNAACNSGLCGCNEGFYDDDGIPLNNAGTCVPGKFLTISSAVSSTMRELAERSLIGTYLYS